MADATTLPTAENIQQDISRVLGRAMRKVHPYHMHIEIFDFF